MKLLYILFSLLLFVGCNQVKDEGQDSSVDLIDTLKISKNDISKLDYIEFVLDQKAQALFISWTSYTDLEGHIDNLKQGNIAFFSENPELLDALIKDFKETLPEEINTPAIQARIKELETKIYKLQSNSRLFNNDKTHVLPVIKELLIAFSNFNLQINKKFEKEAQNIQKP
ncbi:hypothetical protein RXV94_11220 [Yeosuana sp. MJ-SS3]|uniref:Uncharacterized protein n=1 Tax=Gilvirhabdus luticola TaxID=3079858 RepID=A0ABU3U8I5_9FLAO|nr:hypothetical protein [Yeosuana sp. MJ-SS3]MDU8886732.1 hypothetical protein [Yeosuana sp. MJ-SS3]